MSEQKKLNPTASFLIVIVFLALVVYASVLSFKSGKTDIDSSVKPTDNSSDWQNVEFLNTPAGLPGFSFSYASRMSIEDNSMEPNDVEDVAGEVSMVRVYNVEDQERVLSGEVDLASTSADVITLCDISANCFFNLPDVEGQFEDMGVTPLEMAGEVTYGDNTFTIYKDTSFGDLPLTIYVLRFAPGKVFGIHHLGTDIPPSTIDLASIKLLQK